jgi:hypothetical protein
LGQTAEKDRFEQIAGCLCEREGLHLRYRFLLDLVNSLKIPLEK